jgi:hypothetical protein
MNKTTLKKAALFISALVLSMTISYSQFSSSEFLKSAPADAAKYVQSYIAPFANAFGAGLNSGWYNTAKPHKLGGFDITAGFNVGMVPTSAGTFDLAKVGFSSSISATGLAPTISGNKTAGPAISYKSGSYTLASFNAAPGTNWRYIPVPVAQIGVGLPFGTELKGRYLPKINIGDGDVSLWGVGLVHSIMQYLPGNKLLPFDVSLFGGYTKLMGNAPLNVMPDASVSQAYTAPINVATSFNDQKINMSVSALNISAIASLNLPVITFYGGLGYCKTNTTLKFVGNFPTPVLITPTLPATPYPQYNNSGVKTGADFPEMKIDNFSGLRANIGFRIKLAVITIHADYTKAQYNVVSTGLGISFR